MATQTPNINLIKPDKEDYYSINDHNVNSDKIDTFANRTNGTLDNHGTVLGNLQAQINTSNTSATALTSRVTAVEGKNTQQDNKLTDIQTQVTNNLTKSNADDTKIIADYKLEDTTLENKLRAEYKSADATLKSEINTTLNGMKATTQNTKITKDDGTIMCDFSTGLLEDHLMALPVGLVTVYLYKDLVGFPLGSGTTRMRGAMNKISPNVPGYPFGVVIASVIDTNGREWTGCFYGIGMSAITWNATALPQQFERLLDGSPRINPTTSDLGQVIGGSYDLLSVAEEYRTQKGNGVYNFYMNGTNGNTPYALGITTDSVLFGEIKVFGNSIVIMAVNYSGQTFTIGYNHVLKTIYPEGGYKLTTNSGVWSLWRLLSQKTIALPTTSDLFSELSDLSKFPYGVTSFVVNETKGDASNFPWNDLNYYIGEVTKVSGSLSIKVTMTDGHGYLFTNYRTSAGVWQDWKSTKPYKWQNGLSVPVAGTGVMLGSTGRVVNITKAGRVEFIFTNGDVVELRPAYGVNTAYGMQHTATATQKRTFSVTNGSWDIGLAVSVQGTTFATTLKEIRVTWD